MPPVQLLLKNFGLECNFKLYTRVIPIRLFSDFFYHPEGEEVLLFPYQLTVLHPRQVWLQNPPLRPGKVFGEGDFRPEPPVEDARSGQVTLREVLSSVGLGEQ